MQQLKALFIGGTGTISTACTRLALERGFDLTLLNRGTRLDDIPKEAKLIKCDISDEAAAAEMLRNMEFDVVADFIGFTTQQAERDIRLFSGKTKQYIYISSASAYQKPLSSYLITESTPLANPYWAYSRAKIDCENLLMDEYRKNGFPVTIVRPSHTYGERSIPVAVHGAAGGWPVVRRIMEGKPVIMHGDGLTWWTFTFNTDFAAGFVGLMGNIHAIGEAVHITSDEKVTWNAAYECIGMAVGKKPDIVHVASETLAKLNPDYVGSLLGDKAYSVIFDNSKIKRLVPGFTAAVRFDQGIRRSIAYILDHGELQAEDPEFDVFCDKLAVQVRGRAHLLCN